MHNIFDEIVIFLSQRKIDYIIMLVIRAQALDGVDTEGAIRRGVAVDQIEVFHRDRTIGRQLASNIAINSCIE